MPDLHPQIQRVLQLMAEADLKPIEAMTPAEAREQIRAYFAENYDWTVMIRDAQGAEIYAWNAVLEQPVLKPGEHAWFKSRLAAPPPEGRNIDVRFFNKRDLAGGNI